MAFLVKYFIILFKIICIKHTHTYHIKIKYYYLIYSISDFNQPLFFVKEETKCMNSPPAYSTTH